MQFGLFTIGHSTHPLDVFLSLLARHDIKRVADIRRFPGSRKHPQFNRESLSLSLLNNQIDYHWVEPLGGRRQKAEHESSANLGLRNASFRNYADYMATEPFRGGIRALLDDAEQKRTAFMCSESMYWRCHRRLVSDFLLASGIAVRHIMPDGGLRLHTLTAGARIADGDVTYPAQVSGPGKSLFE